MAVTIQQVIDFYNQVGVLLIPSATLRELTTQDYIKALKKAIEEKEKTLQKLPH